MNAAEGSATDGSSLGQDLSLLLAVLSEIEEAVTITRVRDQRLLFANRAFERLVGAPPGEAAGQSLWSIVPLGSGFRERLEEIAGQLSRTGQWEGEVHETDAAGEPTLAWLRIVLHESAEHGAVWIAVRHDVTERTQAETRFRALVDSLPAVVYVADQGADGRYSFLSPQIESLLGFTAGEMQADPTLWRQRLHPDDIDRVLESEADVTGAGPVSLEYRMLARSGDVVWVQDSAVRLAGVPGGPAQWHGVLIDVTDIKRSERAAEQAHRATIERLAVAIEHRDFESAAHIERMGRYCELIARELGLSQERRELLRLASSMHDVGKIGVPDEILLKPGKLTRGERLQVQRHAEIGFDMLRGGGSELLELTAMISLTHHERFDGRGYPRGLAGEDIPLEGRIAAVADVFDAITTDRVYRPAYSVEEALRMMEAQRGGHFDPVVLDAFLRIVDEIVALVPRAAFREPAGGEPAGSGDDGADR